jgi:hypothetical protein
MRSLAASGRRRLRAAIPLLVLLALALCPAAASALDFKVVNESGRPPSEVFVTVAAGGAYEVSGMANDVPKPLSEIPGGEIEIERLVSGRIFVAYGAGVTEATTFSSPTRFDWAELTVTPDSADVANLTAVDQFAIGMRLDTFNSADQHLETVGAANSNTIFAALQQIPGGPEATMRGPGGSVIRVLSPNKTEVYPDLGEYVRSLAGQAITLHTAFFHEPFTTATYSGSFGPDGTITLSGTSTTNAGVSASSSFTVPGSELIADIDTGGNTPNTLEGAIKRDLLAGFSTGLWGGRYGNDALGFCTDPTSNAYGTWCPAGFNQPAFGDARAGLAPFATCEQYAAVINQYSDVYGNPYSDAAKRVTVSLDQTPSGHDVETLQLTIQPDSGNAQPVSGGNPNCAAAPAAGGTAKGSATKKAFVSVNFLKQAKAKGRTAKVARLSCSSACGRVKALAKQGRKVVGRVSLPAAGARQAVELKLTKGAAAAFAGAKMKLKVELWVTPPGGATTHVRGAVTLSRAK